MKINFTGQPEDVPRIRAGYIGCGSHSRRNVLPALKFASAEPVAICDLSEDKAKEFAKEFGFERHYGNHVQMLEAEKLDAVFIATGYDGRARPIYPALAKDCLERGVHVWVEKPPSASVKELLEVKDAAARNDRRFAVGFKKMFAPANEKAKELSERPEFGGISMATLQYPQFVPVKEDFDRYMAGEAVWEVCGFLDHLCHPVSLMLYMMGRPKTLYYDRSAEGAAAAAFTFEGGSVASLALTRGASMNGGMERTFLLSKKGGHITVENNFKLNLHRDPPGLTYGASPSFYAGAPGEASSVWEPEISLGQLYNKGLFLLGYYKEVEDFIQAVLRNEPVPKAGIEDAIDATAVFEAFAKGPGRVTEIYR